jgi:DNA repair photolyase
MGEEKAKVARGPAVTPQLSPDCRELFPILPSTLQAGGGGTVAGKGIARLAAAATPVAGGHEIRFHALAARSILNRSVSNRRLRFTWSINPYRGCEFACRYCYARYTHEFLELRDPALFEREIYIKQQAAWLLRRDLGRVRPGEEIAIGTATDPYQPIERRMGVTRSLLEVLAEYSGYAISIVTKSTLITRDIELLRRVATQNRLVLHVTITTPDTELARLLEPRAPRPDLRFATVRRLRAAGLQTGILCAPLLPGITDSAPALDRMAQLARQVDASFFAANPLFLKPCSKATFLAFVEEHFPALRAEYERRYSDSAFVPRAYGERLRALVRAVSRKHGLTPRSSDAGLPGENGRSAAGEARSAQPRQRELWPGAEQPWERSGSRRLA